jgi:hypothetical protein
MICFKHKLRFWISPWNFNHELDLVKLISTQSFSKFCYLLMTCVKSGFRSTLSIIHSIQLFQLRLSTSKAEKSNTSAKGCWESLWKFVNLLTIPSSLSRLYSTFPLCWWTTLIEIAVYSILSNMTCFKHKLRFWISPWNFNHELDLVKLISTQSFSKFRYLLMMCVKSGFCSTSAIIYTVY